jgi:hypothetical protein
VEEGHSGLKMKMAKNVGLIRLFDLEEEYDVNETPI